MPIDFVSMAVGQSLATRAGLDRRRATAWGLTLGLFNAPSAAQNDPLINTIVVRSLIRREAGSRLAAQEGGEPGGGNGNEPDPGGQPPDGEGGNPELPADQDAAAP